MISPIEVAFVTACTALMSSFISPAITLRMARAQIRASVISNNRQRWIETLRDRVASFCAQAAVTATVRSRTVAGPRAVAQIDKETLARIEELARTFTTIRLMANPHEADHQQLVGVLTRIVAILKRSPAEFTFSETDVEELLEEAVHVSQAILKREWSRVKRGE